MDFAASGVGDSPSARVLRSLSGCQNDGINKGGRVDRVLFAANGTSVVEYGHTCNRRAEARCSFETG